MGDQSQSDIERGQPGYALGILLISILLLLNVAVFVAVPTFPPPNPGLGTY